MLLVACLGVTAAVATAASPTSTGLTFSVYRTTFNKAYLSPASERAARAAFLANDAIIAAHNALNRSYWLGHNRFSDLTLDEFVRVHVGHAKPARPSQERNFDHSLVEASRPISGFNHMGNASSLDWTTKGAVTPVKNQEMCGSCWAFSAIGAVEGHFAIAGHPLAALSVEQVVACDNVESGGLDDGCNGGKMDNAFDWIKTHPLCSNAGYPYASYAGRTKACNTTCAGAVTVGGHTDVPGEAGMLAAIAKGPVSVGVEADTSTFQLYKGGVLDDPACGRQLDHGVLVVGFGTDSASGKKYYKVKNSWGPAWGEEGYLRMVRDKDQCGIADNACFPTGVTNSSAVPPSRTPSAGKLYTISGFARTPASPVWEFSLLGDFASELAKQSICLGGGQYAVSISVSVANFTYVDIVQHVAIRTIASVGDTFFIGTCP